MEVRLKKRWAVLNGVQVSALQGTQQDRPLQRAPSVVNASYIADLHPV